jgi:hypothetical protein
MDLIATQCIKKKKIKTRKSFHQFKANLLTKQIKNWNIFSSAVIKKNHNFHNFYDLIQFTLRNSIKMSLNRSKRAKQAMENKTLVIWVLCFKSWWKLASFFFETGWGHKKSWKSKIIRKSRKIIDMKKVKFPLESSFMGLPTMAQ